MAWKWCCQIRRPIWSSMHKYMVYVVYVHYRSAEPAIWWWLNSDVAADKLPSSTVGSSAIFALSRMRVQGLHMVSSGSCLPFLSCQSCSLQLCLQSCRRRPGINGWFGSFLKSLPYLTFYSFCTILIIEMRAWNWCPSSSCHFCPILMPAYSKAFQYFCLSCHLRNFHCVYCVCIFCMIEIRTRDWSLICHICNIFTLFVLETNTMQTFAFWR